MADITWADVVALASELASFPVLGQGILLADANTSYDASLFGGEDSPRFKYVRILFVAHFATLIGRRGTTAGPMISSSAGGLSRTYANVNTTSGGWGSTPYGTILEMLLAQSGASIGMSA